MQQLTKSKTFFGWLTTPALTRRERETAATKRPVRVCFVIDELAPSGTESQLLALIRHLDRRRIWPYLCLLRGDNPMSQALEPDDCPILRLDVGSLRHPRALLRMRRFCRFLRRERIDVVQTHLADSSFFGILGAWLAGVPHRIRIHNHVGPGLAPRYRRWGRLLNAFTTQTIANCEAARQSLLIEERLRPETALVLENGVDLERFQAIPLPSARSTTTETRVGVVADVRSVKELNVFLRAAALVRTRHPRAKFSVAGEDELRRVLEQQPAAEGVAEHFSLSGSVADVPGFLAGLDVAVLCSHVQGMSNALLEYMAAGRAIVAARIGAAPELIADGVHGLLVPPGDAQKLAERIGRLVEDRELAQRLAAAAQQRAKERYGRKAMVQRFEAFYLSLVMNAAGPSRPPSLPARPHSRSEFVYDACTSSNVR